jgi:acetyl-CoA carboxylase beta subunit
MVSGQPIRKVNHVPWKFCPACKEISYSAATHYETWPCPHCGTDLKVEPEYDIHQAKALRDQNANKKVLKESPAN